MDYDINTIKHFEDLLCDGLIVSQEKHALIHPTLDLLTIAPGVMRHISRRINKVGFYGFHHKVGSKKIKSRWYFEYKFLSVPESERKQDWYERWVNWEWKQEIDDLWADYHNSVASY